MAGALTAAIAAAFSGGAAVVTDDYFEYTTLLLPGNGTNGAQNNTFLDGSTNNFTITRNGNTTQGTFSPFSQTGWGNYFGGGASNINLPSSTDFALGGAFSFECWVYQASIPNQVDLLDVRTSNEVGSLGISSTGFPRWQTGPTTGSLITGSTALTANQWNYLLFVADASGCSIYLNGTRGANTSQVATWPTSARPCFIAGSFANASGGSLNGYVSDVRLIKGSTPYNSTATTVTVPTEFLPFVTNTVLQCCKSNRFVNTVSGTSMTTNGTTSVQAFSPFNPSASWSAATYGGSGYFDGNGDYLSLTDQAAYDFEAGDFSIDFWYYPISAQQYASVYNRDGVDYPLGIYSGTSISPAWPECVLAAGTASSWFVTNLATSGVRQNSWNHVAFTRVGSTWRAFTNGVLSTVVTASGTIASGGIPWIGKNGTAAGLSELSMYLSGFRMVKGGIPSLFSTSSTTTGTSIFTPPSQPVTNSESLTAGSLSLLLNFTNAGIYDATSKNDLETVGNAQISTTQSKWGGSSMSFDGTGDSCDITLSSPFVSDWSANFTIELWAYTNNLSAQHIIFANVGTNSSGYNSAYINANGSIGIGRAGINDLSSASSTWTSGQWNHLAYVRNGVNLNIYYNGSSVASTSSASTYLNSTVVGLALGKNFQTTPAYFNGYMQDVRITKGYARYTSNFTPPTAAFPTL